LPNNHHSIRPGRKSRDPTAAEIRGQKLVNGEVFYRTRYIRNGNNFLIKVGPRQLYHEPLKTEHRKYGSLQTLKPNAQRTSVVLRQS
jgi:hypothetical protein